MKVSAAFLLCVGILFYSSPMNGPDRHSFATGPRFPASTEQSCLEMLRQFYPDQSDEFIKDRMSNNADVHSFYRAFVPLYYKEFFDHPKKMKLFERLSLYKGTISGDAHFENFGIIIDDAGAVHFSINDFDDSTEGFFYYDVLRHFISSQFLTKKIEWNQYLEAYLAAIKNENFSYSKTLRTKLEHAIEGRDSVLAENISTSPPFKFIKFKKPNRKTTPEEAQMLEAALLKKYPEIEILDQYTRIKTDGGSAGMLRFQVLARPGADAKVQWLDIKEMGPSSLDKVFIPKNTITPAERVKKAKANLFDGHFNQSITTLDLLGKTFSLRSVNQFAVGISSADLNKNELVDVALDEAYSLGKIHSLSLKTTTERESYANDWGKIEKNDVLKVIDDISDDFKDTFKRSKE